MTADAGQRSRDERFMGAAIRLARRHLGLTGTNPAVGTLIVDDAGTIVGRGVTAVGGRPHAEAGALGEAGERARGATAYVTLEPCAHHGRTPPCAEALVRAGIRRVVGAAHDPDPRVSGKGYAMLREGGVEVVEKVLAVKAREALSGYLSRTSRLRPEVTLKIAVSADGMIGRSGQGQVSITGPQARSRSMLMRAEADAILVGIGTAIADDPQLTCRLPGLQARSPVRIVLDPRARLPVGSRLLRSAADHPLWIAADSRRGSQRFSGLAQAGARIVAVDSVDDQVALPELLNDLAASGLSSVIVEGGAAVASSFLAEDLVDRIVLFTGRTEVGASGIAAPFCEDAMPEGFRLLRREWLDKDQCSEWMRSCSPAS